MKAASSGGINSAFHIVCVMILMIMMASSVAAQDFERYRPKSFQPPKQSTPSFRKDEGPNEASDKVLVERLNAVIVLDSADKVKPKDANANAKGLKLDFEAQDSLVFTDSFKSIVDGYIGGAISLRRINQLSRDIIQFYRDSDQPVVDVQIPEQKITGGTLQIIIVESRVGEVIMEAGPYFSPNLLSRWIGSTSPGSRVYESSILDDLFWLNQSPFRMVDVDLRPGSAEGTTDIYFQSNEVLPWRFYGGYEDTGVRSLDLERFYAGLVWGNAFRREGLLSYQYTTDLQFNKLHAHAVSWLKAFDRAWSAQTDASWAAVNPALDPTLNQTGESWQVSSRLIRHLVKDRFTDISVSAGMDFKSTNNDLEFGGVNVLASSAELVNVRMGIRGLTRSENGEYMLFQNDLFIGPGNGFSAGHNATAFSSIRPATSPNYVYNRVRTQALFDMGDFQLVCRGVGQYAFDRLLFSEMLGMGGFDSIRGYDQWSFSGDSGWIKNFEFGPRPFELDEDGNALTIYGFFDIGKTFTRGTQPGEFDDLFLMSIGLGLRMTLNQNSSLRLDWGHGMEKAPFIATRDRIHVGYVRQFGPRPTSQR